MKSVERICRTLDTIGASYALIGGRAVGIRGYPRMTTDYDFLTGDRRVLQHSAWRDVEKLGATVDPRKGDFDDPLAGVVHIAFADGSEADIVVAKMKWQQGVIDRAEVVNIGGIDMPVPRTSDLILLKLAAGGILDQQDIVALLAVSDRKRVTSEVDEHVGQLDPDAAAIWERLTADAP